MYNRNIVLDIVGYVGGLFIVGKLCIGWIILSIGS